jgi:4'-phosphopantetheinyl transferase
VNPDSLGLSVSFPSVTALEPGDGAPSLVLEDRTVHVWGFSLEGSDMVLDCFGGYLSPEERVRAARFIHRQDQIRFTLAHGGLRALLARYVGREPAVLRLHTGATGKPALLDQQNHPHTLRFNLSHSHGRMLVAMAEEQHVGIDLEQIRDKVEVLKLAERFYTPAEYQQVLSRTGSEQARQFYRYWVAKEAVLKGQGVGLLSLQQCEIDSSGTLASATAKIASDAAMQSGWTIRWLNCGEGWQGAVSACGGDWAVRVMNEPSN